MVLLASDRALIVDTACLKNVLNTSSFELKKIYIVCNFMKKDFEYSQGLVQII